MQNPYHVNIAPSAHQKILQLTPKQQKTVVKLIETLAINPRPPGAIKIEGLAGLYYQEITLTHIIYKIEEHEVIVLVVK